MRLITLFLLVISLMSTMTLQADDQHNADRQQLKNLLSSFEQALNQADIEQLTSYLRDDVVVTFLNAEVARGIPAVKKYFAKTMSGENAILADYKTQAKSSAPAIFFDRVAIAQGTAEDIFTLKSGHIIPVNTFWSATLVKQTGIKQEQQWQVAQLHFSADLFDNALLISAEKSIYIVSSIVALIALIIGIFIGRTTLKKSAL